jgi:hypothetical protein
VTPDEWIEYQERRKRRWEAIEEGWYFVLFAVGLLVAIVREWMIWFR